MKVDKRGLTDEQCQELDDRIAYLAQAGHSPEEIARWVNAIAQQMRADNTVRDAFNSRPFHNEWFRDYWSAAGQQERQERGRFWDAVGPLPKRGAHRDIRAETVDDLIRKAAENYSCLAEAKIEPWSPIVKIGPTRIDMARREARSLFYGEPVIKERCLLVARLQELLARRPIPEKHRLILNVILVGMKIKVGAAKQ